MLSWFGGRKGIRPEKKLFEWWDAAWLSVRSEVQTCTKLMLLPLTVSCFSKLQIGFNFLIPAKVGTPGQRTIKWVLCEEWLKRVKVK